MKLLLSVLLSLLFNISWGVEVGGEIHGRGNYNAAKVGSFIQARMLLGPHGDNFEKQVKELKGKPFLGPFFVHRVESLNILEGGKKYLEANLTLILLSPLQSAKALEWVLPDKKIPFKLIKISSSTPDLKPKGLIVLSQKISWSFSRYWPWVLGGVLLLSLLSYFLFKKWRQRRLRLLEKRKKEDIKKYWKKKIISSGNRKEVEYLFKEREAWSPLFDIQKELLQTFFEKVEAHQYRPSWHDYDVVEVQQALERLKQEVKKEHGI